MSQLTEQNEDMMDRPITEVPVTWNYGPRVGTARLARDERGNVVAEMTIDAAHVHQLVEYPDMLSVSIAPIPARPFWRYRSRAAQVEAVRWDGDNTQQCRALAGTAFDTIDPEDRTDDSECTAQVLTSAHSVWVAIPPGAWVVRDETGVLNAWTHEAFTSCFEPSKEDR